MKHSLIIITYNQDKFINETLNSVMDQTLLPDEIIISDDCSTDKTWDIVKNFCFPEETIVKLNRNKSNLGIYRNLEVAINKATGTLYTFLAGDDLLDSSTFRAIDEALKREIISTNDKVMIVSNTKELYPNQKTHLIDNFILRNVSPFKLRLRNEFKTRSVGISSSIVSETFFKNKELSEIGYGFDLIKGLYEIQNCTKFIYINSTTSIYRRESGVTINLKGKDYFFTELKTWKKVLELFNDSLDKRDLCYVKMQLNIFEYKTSPSIFKLLLALLMVSINIPNFYMKNDGYKNFKFLLPKKVVSYLKQIYLNR